MARLAALATAVLLVAGLCARADELPGVAARADCYAACPQLKAATLRRVQLLHNPGFTVAYDSELREPRWVAYQASALPQHAAASYRHGFFTADSRVIDPVGPFDYRGSGYDRGHLAPAFLLTALYGKTAGDASYLMSNVTPQRAHFNRLLWERLEEAEAHKMARDAGTLWVLAGPVFGNPVARTLRGVAIPVAFFRIWLATDVSSRQPRACAFIVPQQVRGDEPLTDFVTTVDAVEARTGLDFFAAMESHLQTALEASLPDDRWPLAAIANWPARYAGEALP